jgi:eukaryotic-like serine/threonine-protein kinase
MKARAAGGADVPVSVHSSAPGLMLGDTPADSATLLRPHVTPSEFPDAPRPGEVIAENYTLIEPIGRGGMAVVYLAEDKRLRRLVAIKIMTEALVSDDANRKRFEREARVMASLEHDHIAPVYLIGEHQQFPFFVTKLLNGKNLSLLLKEGPMDWERILRLLTPIASALDYVHSRGMVHRDVKPSNIFLSEGERAWLIDFGIAKPLAEPALTRTGNVLGTMAYLAPECITESEHGPASDQYGLALVVYQLLTQNLPFAKTSDFEMTKEKTGSPHLRLDGLPAARAAIKPVLQRALALSPRERFETCEAFMRALAEPQSAPVRHTQLLPIRSVQAKSSVRWAFLLAAIGLIATTGIWSLIAIAKPDTAKPDIAPSTQIVLPLAPTPVAAPATETEAKLEAATNPDKPVTGSALAEVQTPPRKVESVARPEAAKRARTARLSIQALKSTGGAVSSRVLLDGKEIGLTPLMLGEVSAGKHVLVFTQNGFIDDRQSVVLRAGQELRVVGRLVPR